MRKTDRNLIQNIALWFPLFSKIHVMRDPGQISEHLANIGYKVRILTYRNDWNKGIKDINGVELVTLNSRAKLLRLIGFPLHYYVLRNRKTIDCLFLFFAGFNNAVAAALFRLFNRQGICIVKMDSDGRLYDSSRYSIVMGSNATSYEAIADQPNLAERAFRRFFGELTFRIFSFSVDLLIIESPEARQRVLNRYPQLEHKLIVLPNGVNQKHFDELSQHIKTDRKRKILFVGRVEYAKGIDLLVEAFSRLKDKYPDWNVELVGEMVPSFKDKVEKLISRDLRDRVVLAGPLYDRDLAERYLGAEIFCLASRGESFGIVLIEALYFGCAVVSSDVGAARYVLDYGNAGLIFEPENVEHLTACLDKLMGDEELREKLAAAGKSRCGELFSWEKIIAELDNHIATVAAAKHHHWTENIH